MPEELTKALLLEEVAEERAIAEALFASVMHDVPLVQALVESGAVTSDVLARYLGRADTPFLRHVVPVAEIVERLPPGLCARLLAVPVRRDAITGTVDVVVADPQDPHPAAEIAFHLGVPVRVVRAPVAAIQDALHRRETRARPPSSRPGPRPREELPPSYDSRPRPFPPDAVNASRGASATRRMATLPPPGARAQHEDPRTAPKTERAAPRTSYRPPSAGSHDVLLAALEAGALRPSRTPTGIAPVVPSPAAPVLARPAGRTGRDTPPWGTPIHNAAPTGSDPPKSGLGSEIPIPLTRRTFSAVNARGGTQRPPPLVADRSPLGEGYALPVDPKELQVVELRRERTAAGGPPAPQRQAQSFIPGPPPIAAPTASPFAPGTLPGYAPQTPAADLGAIMAAIRSAGSRDEVLELVLSAARMLAFRVALFVVKRGGYLGWACTPEFADRGSLQQVLVPIDTQSAFDDAVREGLYLGPIPPDEVHASLLGVMRSATKDVAFVPIRVSGKTAVIIVADELGDTMIATRRLEEVARAAGESFARIVRTRR